MQKLAEAIGTCNVLLRLGVVEISAEQRFWILTEAAKAIGATGHSEAALKRNTEGERSFESCRGWWKFIIHSNDKTASNLEPFQVWNNLLKSAAENIKQFLTSSVHSEETVLGYLERAEYYLQQAKKMREVRKVQGISSANLGWWYTLTGSVLVRRLWKDFLHHAPQFSI
jgi:hypothetical protein